MGHLDDHRAEELGSRGSELQDAARDRFSLHQRWWVDQLVLLQIPAEKSLEILSSSQFLFMIKNYLQVTLMGMGAFLGGMITRTPE